MSGYIYAPTTSFDVVSYLRNAGATELEGELGQLPEGFGEILSLTQMRKRYPSILNGHIDNQLTVPKNPYSRPAGNGVFWKPVVNEQLTRRTNGLIIVGQESWVPGGEARNPRDLQFHNVVIGSMSHRGSQRLSTVMHSAPVGSHTIKYLTEVILHIQDLEQHIAQSETHMDPTP